MKAIGKVLVCIFLLMAVSAPGEAQEEDGSPGSGFCDQELSPERLMGDWTVEASPTRMTSLVTGPFEYQGSRRVSQAYIDWKAGVLVLSGAEVSVRLTEVEPHGPEWRWSDDPMLLGDPETGAGVTSKDMELAYDCEIEDFPRLVGYPDPPYHGMFRLVVFDHALMIGAWSFQTAHGLGVASLTLTR